MKKLMTILPRTLILLPVTIFVWGFFVHAAHAAEAIEGIVAVIGDEIVLKSELDEQVALYCMQAQIDPADTTKVNPVRKEILGRMIDAKVIINEAKKRKLTVPEQELNQAVEDAVKEVKGRMGSPEKFKEALDKEGLTEEKLRGKYRQELEAQLLATKLVEREIRSKIKATDEDVAKFYKERKQDLPKKPAEVTLAQVVVLAEADSAVEKKARDKAEQVLKAIGEGQNFEKLAAQYSDDPSAQNGGDVGVVKKGEFEEGFEKTAMALQPGQVSGLVRSRFGYHIIKMVEKNDEGYHVKHILIKVVPSDEAEQKARSLATKLRKKIEAGESFEDVAKKYSQDKETAAKGGLVGSYPSDGLAPAVRTAIKGLPDGGVTEVVPLDIGYHIFRVVGKTPEREYTYDEIKDQLRQMVLQERMQNKYEQWLAEIKKKTFIDIKGS
jgi:peptidyl-prolyl cis-trans isomerase SurA